MLKVIRVGIVFLGSLVLVNAPSYGQQTLGAINGTVIDISGAVVQNAIVKVHNAATGFQQSVNTKADVSFSIVDLPVSEISVNASMYDATQGNNSGAHIAC